MSQTPEAGADRVSSTCTQPSVAPHSTARNTGTGRQTVTFRDLVTGRCGDLGSGDLRSGDLVIWRRSENAQGPRTKVRPRTKDGPRTKAQGLRTSAGFTII